MHQKACIANQEYVKKGQWITVYNMHYIAISIHMLALTASHGSWVYSAHFQFA